MFKVRWLIFGAGLVFSVIGQAGSELSPSVMGSSSSTGLYAPRSVEIPVRADSNEVNLLQKWFSAWKRKQIGKVYELLHPDGAIRCTFAGNRTNVEKAMTVWREKGADKYARGSKIVFSRSKPDTLEQGIEWIRLLVYYKKSAQYATLVRKESKIASYYTYSLMGKRFIVTCLRTKGKTWILNQPFDLESPPYFRP